MSDTLRQAAAAVARKARAPYSGLHVGAALMSASGRMYLGCNVECGALPLGGCAERAAIAAAVVAEGATLAIASIAIVAIDRDGHPVPAPPCGACRQMLLELASQADVVFLDPAGCWQRVRACDLLPLAFSLSR